jgi:hypothetical protein
VDRHRDTVWNPDRANRHGQGRCLWNGRQYALALIALLFLLTFLLVMIVYGGKYALTSALIDAQADLGRRDGDVISLK